MSVVLFEMCEEEKALDVLLYAELDRVIVENGTVKGITVLCKGHRMSFGADVVIDGTGDGHVIYQAGAKYEKGGSKHKGGMQSPALCF